MLSGRKRTVIVVNLSSGSAKTPIEEKSGATYDNQISELQMASKGGSLGGNTLHKATITSEY